MNDLTKVAKKVDEVFVKHLEGLLEQAKSGDLQGMIHVDLLSGGDTSYGWCANATHDHNMVIGALFSLMTALGNNSEGMFKDIRELKEIMGVI